jgi:hypothetical protein
MTSVALRKPSENFVNFTRHQEGRDHSEPYANRVGLHGHDKEGVSLKYAGWCFKILFDVSNKVVEHDDAV